MSNVNDDLARLHDNLDDAHTSDILSKYYVMLKMWWTALFQF